MKKVIIAGYFFFIFSLVLYSYTQIDLSLTFSKIEFLRNIIKSFQYVGYFNRPLSVLLDIIILVFLFNFYLCFLIFAKNKILSAKIFWKIIIITVVILTFSYNAYSYDLFNYIFDAKIITHYNQNPYIHKALDFPTDPMLSFMHWTHRVYPYGPIWLVLTVPLSYLGFNLFIPTFFLFKALISASFIGTLYYIDKISRKIWPTDHLISVAFFAFNPLVIIEVLISSHLDIVMLFFAVWSIHLLLTKKYLKSIILLAISVGIKFVTLALIPFFIAIIYLQKTKSKLNFTPLFYFALFSMLTTVVYASQRTNFQPWYLLEALFIAAFLIRKYFILIPASIISFAAALNYTPFLYLGNWDPPVPQLITNINLISYITSFIAVLAYYYFKKQTSRKPKV